MPRPMVPTDDLYARLEVPPEASFEAIEIAWRALLKRHHPDVAGNEALELAKRINVAHDWLGNPELRARYDQARRPGRRGGERTLVRWPIAAVDVAGPAGGQARTDRSCASPRALPRPGGSPEPR